MRRTDEDAMPPEVAAALLAVDATLAGDPVDPEYADLAELALILAEDRPAPDVAFATALDERVERRFARPARPGRSGARRAWGWTPSRRGGRRACGGRAGGPRRRIEQHIVVVVGQRTGSVGAAPSETSPGAKPRRSLLGW